MSFPSTDLPKLKDEEDSRAVRKSVNDLLDKINQLSLQIDDLNTVLSNSQIISGSNAYGNWVKYPDGTLEQYGRQAVTLSAGLSSLTFPLDFYSVDYQLFIVNSVQSGSWWYYLFDDDALSPKYGRRTVRTAQFGAYAGNGVATPGTPITATVIVVPFFAIGRWKA